MRTAPTPENKQKTKSNNNNKKKNMSAMYPVNKMPSLQKEIL